MDHRKYFESKSKARLKQEKDNPAPTSWEGSERRADKFMEKQEKEKAKEEKREKEKQEKEKAREEKRSRLCAAGICLSRHGLTSGLRRKVLEMAAMGYQMKEHRIGPCYSEDLKQQCKICGGPGCNWCNKEKCTLPLDVRGYPRIF